jgi:hypothetical protein
MVAGDPAQMVAGDPAQMVAGDPAQMVAGDPAGGQREPARAGGPRTTGPAGGQRATDRAGGRRSRDPGQLARPRLGSAALPAPLPGTAPTPELAALRAREAEDVPGAIQRYQRAAGKRRDVAEYALYRLAYVELVWRRDPAAALRWADAVERRFPGGAHAERTHWLRIYALHAADDRPSCRAAAQSYLQRFAQVDPDRAAAARRLTSWY